MPYACTSIRELAIAPVIKGLTAGERSLLFGMIESELVNGKALVPTSLEQEALSLVAKCEAIIQSERDRPTASAH